MHLRLTNCLFLVLIAASASFAQGTLPPTVSGWNFKSGSTVTSADMERIAGQLAPAFREYGATAAQAATYTNAGQGAKSFRATLYTFQDASGAYGVYSYLRTPDMTKAKYSSHSAKSYDRVLVLTGNLVLEIDGKDVERSESAIKSLAAAVATHAEQGVYPSLPLQLPTEDLIRRSDHYFLGPVALSKFWPAPAASGDWLGFSRGGEAEEAKYRVQNHELILLLADFPTPQIAAAQMQQFSDKLNLNGPKESGSASRSEPVVYWRRDGTLIALVAGAPSESSANEILDKIRSGVVLTWNEPAFKLHEPTMAAVIVGTIIGTGEIMLFTIFGGIAFTIIRLGVKRVLPGKVFDRPKHFEILQLGLSSKPINAKDFY